MSALKSSRFILIRKQYFFSLKKLVITLPQFIWQSGKQELIWCVLLFLNRVTNVQEKVCDKWIEGEVLCTGVYRLRVKFIHYVNHPNVLEWVR